MNFPAVPSPGSKDAPSQLWTSEQRCVEFTPNESAVVDLLKFLGFSKVETKA
jgi:hypothetical protein